MVRYLMFFLFVSASPLKTGCSLLFSKHVMIVRTRESRHHSFTCIQINSFSVSRIFITFSSLGCAFFSLSFFPIEFLLKDRYETTPDRLYKRKSLNLTQLVVLGWTKICQIFNTVHVLVLFFCFLRGPETWLRKPGSVHISHTGSEPCVF